MNAESVVALVALVVTVPLSIVAIVLSRAANRSASRSAAASERAAETAEEQTTIQRALSRRSAEPALYVDLRPDPRAGRILRLVVGNSGPTVATKVRVTFDPPMAETKMKSDSIHLGEEVLRAGLASLPPGREVNWIGGAVGDVISQNADSALSWAVTINADGPFGPLEPLTYTLDLKGLTHSTTAPTGTLYGVTHELRQIQTQLKALTSIEQAAYRLDRDRDADSDSPEE